MTEVMPARDFSLRMRVAAYTSLPALLFVSSLAAIPLVAVALVRGTDPTNISILAALLLTVVAELAVVGAALAWTHQFKTARDVLGLKNFRLKTVAMGAGLGLFFLVGLQVLAVLLAASGNSVESSDTSVSLGSAEGFQRYLVLFLIVPLIVPFVEELYFRGYVLGFLLKGHRLEGQDVRAKMVKVSILFSALFFSLAHFQGASSATDFFILIWIFMFAIVLGVVRVKTDSIYPTYAAHLVYNGLTSVLLFISL